MEAKLEEYRLRKRRKQNWESFKDRVRQFIMPRQTETTIAIESSSTDKAQKKPGILVDKQPSTENEALLTNETDEETLSDIASEASLPTTPSDKESKFFKYTLRVVFFLFWITLYIIAIELKFGIVYLMFSALIGIYLNTRTGPKKPGEISAYSVFNENCESIDGTLKAEQFEKELFFKAPIGK